MTPFGICCRSSILRSKFVLSPHPFQMRMHQPLPCPTARAHIVHRAARELRLRTTEIIGKFCVCVCVCVCLSVVCEMIPICVSII